MLLSEKYAWPTLYISILLASTIQNDEPLQSFYQQFNLIFCAGFKKLIHHSYEIEVDDSQLVSRAYWQYRPLQ